MTAATIARWFQPYEGDDWDWDAPQLTLVDHVSIEREDGSTFWSALSFPIFEVAVPTFDGRDSYVGETYYSIPPAQQYGLRLTLWVRRQAAAAAAAKRPAKVADEPF